MAAGGFVLVKAGVLRSYNLYVGFSQAPEHVEGKGRRRVRTPRSCDPDVGFSQAPEHVEGGFML
jgi:hypothetical protein